MRVFPLSICCAAISLTTGVLAAPPACGQAVEVVGSRALGMAGAFVSVANDSSASWWNPAGLAAGPFLDLALAWNTATVDGRLPAGRTSVSSATLGTPPFGISYYRLQITDIRAVDSTGPDDADREDRRAGLGVRSLSFSQFGVTILHTLLTGVHVGTTVKYVRGTPRGFAVDDPETGLIDLPTLLDAGSELEGGEAAGTLDLDVGVLAVAGPLRVGGVMRNLRAPVFGDVRMPRQVRVGAAFDGEAVGRRPLVVAIDADLRAYDAGAGARRVIAVGAEQWLLARRLGVRAGARLNTAGAADEAVTAGASVAARAGVYIDGHVVYGGGAGEQGWGVAARVSF